MLLSSPQLHMSASSTRVIHRQWTSWDDQAQAAWVLRLQGDAELAFEEGTLNLKAGDCLISPLIVNTG